MSSQALRIRCQILLLSFFLLFIAAPDSVAQENSESQNAINNGSFEIEDNGYPTHWAFPIHLTDSGYELTLDSEEPFDGDKSALLDATNKTGSGFGMINHFIDPEPFRGKRVRFRAAVKTAERSEEGRAQLWLKVSREKGVIGAFDNMDPRPITGDQWKHYDIVVDVDEDAESMIFGMLVLGKCKAWIDDASFEVVDDSTELTTMPMVASGSNAANAVPQNYYNHWLWLAVVTLILFALSHCQNSQWQRFALRFTLIYFVLYSFPSPFSDAAAGCAQVVSKTGVSTDSFFESYMSVINGYQERVEAVANWTAKNVLGIEEKLVSSMRNGSGDTTVAYIKLLIYFTIAIVLATIWSLIAIRQTRDHTWLRDLLRTYLRYVLALTMLGYGLHKAGFISTQFAQGGVPSGLDRTYGSSSPMGLLWTFMAASPVYTFFGGMGEVIGGLLLVFRRTMTLGALVTFGVMLNIVMLNFCYDVPVKQYSFHLMIMALFIAGPDVSRLMNVLFFNRPTETSNLLTPAYAKHGTKRIWVHRSLKALFVICLFAIPVYDHVYREVTYEHPEKAESEHLLINRGFHWINEYPFRR